MIDERTKAIADRLGIVPQLEKLHRELLEIPYIVDVEYDIRDMADIHYLIFLPKRADNFTRDDLTDFRENFGKPGYVGIYRRTITKVLEVAANNGCTRTNDRIEDYGQHWYIVAECDW